MTIGKRIQALRKEKGLTQKELGEKLGVSASMIGQYETDLRKPKIETLEKISAALGVAVSDIVDVSTISPSLNSALPLMLKFTKNIDKQSSHSPILLSDEERIQIKELAGLIKNIPDEISSNHFFSDIMRQEYISLFDRLNFNGKYLAIQAVTDLVNNPELNTK